MGDEKDVKYIGWLKVWRQNIEWRKGMEFKIETLGTTDEKKTNRAMKYKKRAMKKLCNERGRKEGENMA